MNVVDKMKSIIGNKDVFGNSAPFNMDHTFPLSLGGTDCKKNKLKLSMVSNQEKGNKTKGRINEIRYSVLRVTSKPDSQGNQSIYGVMYIKPNKDKDEWFEIING